MILTPAHKLMLYGAGAVVLIASFWVWVAAGERRARDLAIAEEHEKAAQQLKEQADRHQAELRAQQEQVAKLIEANQELAQRLASQVAARNSEAAAVRAALLTPKAPAEVIKDSERNLGITPVIADGSVRLTQEQFQQLIAIKVDRDRLEANNQDQDKQIRLQAQTIGQLSKANDGLQELVAQKDAVISAQAKTIEGYKKVAKKSKLRRFGETTLKVGTVILPAVIVGVIVR